MTDVLRLIAINICIPIYTSIPKLYSIFYNLANARFFEDDSAIRHLSSNIYILISVVMLFVFSATLLSAIVDPERLDDKNKGVVALIKRCFFGVILIVIIPFAFNTAYDVQQQVMEKSFIEKVLLGFSFDKNTAGNSNGGGNGGQVIAGSLIQAVIYPVEDDISATIINQNIADTYEKMITDDVEKMRLFEPDINAVPSNSTSDAEYVFEFQGLIAIIAGAVTLYILLIFAIDTAVRLFQLALYELTSPIIIVAYMAKGKDSLVTWAKQVWSVYLDVFMRIAAMAIYIFMIQQLPNLVENFKKVNSTQTTWHLLFSVILIVGLLIFVKRIPDLINKAFGTKISIGGGIGGRLGQMALIGKQAQKAWDAITKNPVRSTVGAVAGTASSVFAGGIRAANQTLRNGGSNLAAFRNALGASAWKMLTAPAAFRRGWNTANLRSIGNEIARDRDTHPEGSTLGGRIYDLISDGALGLGTRQDQLNYRIAAMNRYMHNGRAYTRQQLNELRGQYEQIRNETQSGMNSIAAEINRDDSYLLSRLANLGVIANANRFNFYYDDGTGTIIRNDYIANNMAEANEILESLRESGPQADNYYYREVVDAVTGAITRVHCEATDAGAVLDLDLLHQAQANYQESLNQFERVVRQRRQDVQTYLTDQVLNGTANFALYNRAHDNTNSIDATQHMNMANNYINTPGYAPGVNVITDFASLQAANDASTHVEGQIRNTIDTVDAERNAQYQTQQYQNAERDNLSYNNRNNNNNSIHSTDRNAGDHFR